MTKKSRLVLAAEENLRQTLEDYMVTVFDEDERIKGSVERILGLYPEEDEDDVNGLLCDVIGRAAEITAELFMHGNR